MGAHLVIRALGVDGLTPSARAVLAAMAVHAVDSDACPRYWAGLARLPGNPSTVKHAVKLLRERGYLRILTAGHNGRNATYELFIPAEVGGRSRGPNLSTISGLGAAGGPLLSELGAAGGPLRRKAFRRKELGSDCEKCGATRFDPPGARMITTAGGAAKRCPHCRPERQLPLIGPVERTG